MIYQAASSEPRPSPVPVKCAGSVMMISGQAVKLIGLVLMALGTVLFDDQILGSQRLSGPSRTDGVAWRRVQCLRL